MASIYNEELQFRRVDLGKWKEFDGPALMKLQQNEETWLTEFSKIQLMPHVPREIQTMFEVCRGAMIYSWFYYPLATLGMEHCFRTLELAVRIRVGTDGQKQTFEKNIDTLVERRVLDNNSSGCWHASRSLRNSACHPTGTTLADPGMALRQLRTTAELIQILFPQ